MDNSELVWRTLMNEIGNPYGVAGLMGNLMAESSMNPICKTGGSAEIRKISGSEYAKRVMSGKIKMEDFAHDNVAFGLAQWRYWSRKKSMYDYIVNKLGLDIRSAGTQAIFLLKEIRTYKTVWKTLLEAKSVKEASDIVLIRYEKPANVSDAAKEKRAKLGKYFYEHFAQKEKLISFEEIVQVLEDIRDNEKITDIGRKEKLEQVIRSIKENAVKTNG